MTYRLKTSAAMGTVELTGLEIIATQAFGQLLAIASHSVFTMPIVTTLLSGHLNIYTDGHQLRFRKTHEGLMCRGTPSTCAQTHHSHSAVSLRGPWHNTKMRKHVAALSVRTPAAPLPAAVAASKTGAGRPV